MTARASEPVWLKAWPVCSASESHPDQAPRTLSTAVSRTRYCSSLLHPRAYIMPSGLMVRTVIFPCVINWVFPSTFGILCLSDNVR